MTKYYCDFCKKEIVEDKVYGRLSVIRGIKGFREITIHAHKECFMNFVGKNEEENENGNNI